MIFSAFHNKWLNRPVWLLRVALGVVFLYSGVEKLLHPQDFLATIYDFKLTGPGVGVVTAMIMPWLELLLSFALLTGLFTGGALLATSGLCLLFLGIQASAIVRGLNINCGCFGPDEHHLVGKLTLLRTFTIFLAAAGCWLWGWLRSGMVPPSHPDLTGDPIEHKPVSNDWH